MRYWIGAATVIFVAIFQAASAEEFSVLGVAPNVVLVLLVAWTVVRGLDDVLPMVAIAGVTLALVGLQTPGLVLLALLPLAGLGLVREMHIVHSDLLLVLVLVLVGSLAYESIMLAAVALTGGPGNLLLGFRHDVFPAAIVNLAITPPIYFAMRLTMQPGVRRRLSY